MRFSRKRIKLGSAFADNVSLAGHSIRMPRERELRGWGARITFFYLILIIFFFLLSARLFHLAVVNGFENRKLSENNRVRSITLHAPRGILTDRRGTPLTKNIPAYRVTGPCAPRAPCPVRLVSEENWKEKNGAENSIFFEHDFMREYVYPQETAHVLGFLGEITEEEITNPLYRYQDYLLGDRLGRIGLESVFEKRLRGSDGKELIEVDSQNNRVRSLGKVDAIAGEQIELSLDADLQRVAYQALGEYPGAVVVSKPKTGEILAMASSPSFDPNKLHQGISHDDYNRLVESIDQPLFNRAISGVYPPGSIFKIISATAGLESGAVTAQTIVDDVGILHLGTFSFSNWYFTQYGKTEGNVDILKAIARSNDTYFYKLGEATGIDTIALWGKKFGLGERTGIELTGESEGLMPDRAYQKRVRGSDWYTGDSYNIAIGQGDLQTTPLQINRITNVIASGGVLCPLTLLKQTGAEKHGCTDLKIKPQTVSLITEGMRRACSNGQDTGYQGTGYPLFDFSVMHEEIHGDVAQGTKRSIPVACKTGTAEVGDPEEKTHAWFTAFAPILGQTGDTVVSGDPEIVVTVLIEKGGEGSSIAAPIAKKILEEWFKR